MNNVLAGWILLSAGACIAGWGLSLLHGLSRAGYGVVIALGGLAAAALWLRQRGRASAHAVHLPRLATARRRFRQPLPALYAVLWTLAFLGGALYAPNNYDALSYRFPRVLHWVAAGTWHWVRTPNPRINYSGCVQEWLLTPLLVLTHSDRLFFLINMLSYALLPGLAFSVLRSLGVRARVAYVWMWLLPSALVFAMQAGGIGNDALGAVYLLAALHFATVARRANSGWALALATLATALMTGVKASNLPLALAPFVALLPLWRIPLRRPIAATAIAVACFASSILPTVILNRRHTGDSTGDPTNAGHMKLSDPAAGLVGNALQAAYTNLAPPILPAAGTVNRLATAALPMRLQSWLASDFPRFRLEVAELPQEETAGLGLVIVALVASIPLAQIVLRARRGRRGRRGRGGRGGRGGRPDKIAVAIVVSGYVAALAYAAIMGSEATARIMAPYYFLLLVPVLWLGAALWLTYSRVWRACALLAPMTAAAGIVLTPSRPLFPAATVTAAAADSFRTQAAARAQTVYANYARRAYAFAPVIAMLPSSAKTVGVLLGENDPESSLWRPFGCRQIDDMTDAGQLAVERTDAIVVSGELLNERVARQLSQLVGAGQLTPLGHVSVETYVKRGPQDWYVYLLRNSPQG